MAELTMLQTAGQVAGIGGLALGVLTLIFRDVIRKNIFPNLGRTQAYQLIRMIVVLTFCIAAIGIGAWAFVNWRQPEAPSDPAFPPGNPQLAMEDHLQLIDAERYGDAYEALASQGKKRFHRDQFIATFDNQRKPLGKLKSRRLVGSNSYSQLPGLPAGAYSTSTFISEFDAGKYMEAVTTYGEAGTWKPLFHNLGPCMAPYCG